MLKQKSFQGEKLESAYLLLIEDSTTLEKVDKVKILLKGIDPSLDRVLEKFSKAGLTLGKLSRGEVLSLSAEALPERTEGEKKRKKGLLLFFSSWRSLKSEVARVKKIYSEEGSDSDSNPKVESVSKFGKIFGLAKGPFGLVTLVAVGVVSLLAYLNLLSVSVNVKNEGCSPISPKIDLPVAIPGIKIPKESIISGASGVYTVPPLKVELDDTGGRQTVARLMGFDMPFHLQAGTDIIFDGQSLRGKATDIDLGSSKNHNLIVRCK